jgi:hypothetical protein
MGKPITDEQRQQIVQKHVPDTLKLYLEGKSEQFWLRENKPGVILLMNGASVDQTKATVQRCRLLRTSSLGWKFIPVGLLMPPALQIQGK